MPLIPTHRSSKRTGALLSLGWVLLLSSCWKGQLQLPSGSLSATSVAPSLSPSPSSSPSPSPPPGGGTSIPPLHYFRFEDSSQLGKSSLGTATLDFSYYSPQVTQSPGGQVGGYALFGGGLVASGSASLPASTSSANGIAVELLLLPGRDFGRRRMDKLFTIGTVSAALTPEAIQFNTPDDNFSIVFDGIGPKSLGYYLDGQWHHLVFQYNASTGAKEVHIDGVLPVGFSKTGPVLASLFPSSTTITLNSGTIYDMYRGGLDELAIYPRTLPPTLIQLHHQNRLAGAAYSFTDSPGLVIPAAPATSGILDGKEFAPGTVLPTSSTQVAQGVNVSALNQLQKFPSPRFRAGSGLPRNPSYFAWDYLGNLQYNSAAVANQIGSEIYTEMADRWNYHLTLRTDFSTQAHFADPNQAEYWLRKVTLSRPDLPLWALTLRVQNTAAQRRQDLPAACYVRNASGAFTLFSNRKRIRPFLSSSAAGAAGCPDSSYDADANFVINGFGAALSNAGIHPQTVVAGFSDNNEFLYPMSTAALSADPAVNADYVSSGMGSLLKFDTNHFGRLDSRFRDLVKASHPRLANAIFQSYQVDTDQGYFWEWTQFRQSFTPWQGNFLATTDFYPRFPNNWRTGYGAWHGLQWMMKARRYQIDKGDRLYSPYTAAGWDADEGLNIRPAQWLGLQKIIQGLGAPYTFPGYYVEAAPWPKAEAYIHQVATPIYAQAALSFAEDLLLNGELLDGDVPLNPTDSATARPGYEFWGGDPRMKIIVRKSANAPLYLIIGTLQPLSSQVGNAELSKTAKITLAGQPLQFEVRRQGSIYLYDNRNSANPIFYALDSWHEATHPWHWSQNTLFEAELAEAGLSSAAPELRTETPPQSAPGDYSNTRTYVSFPNGQTSFGAGLLYTYRPTDTVSRTVYLLARTRSASSPGKISVRGDNGTPVDSGTIASTDWTWYPVTVSGLNTPSPHSLRLLPSHAQIEIDKILLSSSAP